MCGILGHFSFGDARPDVELWRALVNLLGHRGPDDSTFWHDGPFVFGHRRLSIIDLSDGSQPMATDDGRLVVVFNGEIYNYVELRDQLTARGYRFRTQSDTEVLLHGYREWRTELPCHLRGMFAFALADRARRELFVARDRFGEKPLFYTQHAGGVSFGSEMKVLAALPELRRDVDDESLAAFLCLNYVPGTATMLRDVHRIGPATWHLWAADGCVRAGAYWSPPDPREADLAVSIAFALLGALAVVVFGTLIGSYLAIHGVLQSAARNWFGLEGLPVPRPGPDLADPALGWARRLGVHALARPAPPARRRARRQHALALFPGRPAPSPPS